MNHTTIKSPSRRLGSLTTILTASLLVLTLLVIPVQGQSASILLNPDQGVSATTIEGGGFSANTDITIYWDGEPIPTLPLQVITDEVGAFTCIISVSTPSSLGIHEVKAVDATGNSASASFTVIDVRGPPGEQGLPGSDAEGITPGYLAGLFLLAVALGGLIGLFLGRDRQAKPRVENQMN